MARLLPDWTKAPHQFTSMLVTFEYICKIWTSEPDRFILNPIHQMPGLNTSLLYDDAANWSASISEMQKAFRSAWNLTALRDAPANSVGNYITQAACRVATLPWSRRWVASEDVV